MDWLTIIGIGIGLSMDAVAVCLAASALSAGRPGRALRMPLAFGAFQGLMPLLGAWGGASVAGWVGKVDHWIAFGLLALIGGKMLWEAFKHDDDDRPKGDPFAWGTLLVLAIATSIDALAAGLSLGLMQLPVLASSAIIAAITALLCLPAVWLGRRLGERWQQTAEVVGGLVLVAIGVKILVAG
jgi:putative Mn2+ efflux pump MntP